MKEEKQVQEQEVEKVKSAEQQAYADVTDEAEEEKSKYVVVPGVYVTRKTDVKGGKKYNTYYVHGVIRGEEVKIKVEPGKKQDGFTNVDAYTLLNIVFGPADKVDFAACVVRRKDFSNNRTLRSLEYFAYCCDEYDGEIVAPLRFDGSPSKFLVSKLVELANRRAGLGLPVD